MFEGLSGFERQVKDLIRREEIKCDTSADEIGVEADICDTYKSGYRDGAGAVLAALKAHVEEWRTCSEVNESPEVGEYEGRSR
ncbi:MAG: hypothetical protein NVS1B14_01680 [Vulcanimicrobiaceae bacterium]